jgi:Mg-chelatase subunit ChlD
MNIMAILGGLVVLLLACLTCSYAGEPRPKDCRNHILADIYILADSSSSINDTDWRRLLQFVADLVNEFQLGPHHVQIGFGIYSRRFLPLVNLNSFLRDKEGLIKNITATKRMSSTTHTGDAINDVNHLHLLTAKSLGGRPDATKVLIIVTDGESNNFTLTSDAADALRDAIRCKIFAVGVGKFNNSELLAIAGNARNVFSVDDYESLSLIKASLVVRICHAKPCPRAQVDIVFLVDSSGSIGKNNYFHNFAYIKKVVKHFPKGFRFALFIYGTHVAQISPFTSNKEKFNRVLDNVFFKGSTSHLERGLRTISRYFKKEGRRGANWFSIVVTDGKSSKPQETLRAANHARNLQITIAVLVVGKNPGQQEINAIATRSSLVYLVANYKGLNKFVDHVSEAPCHEHKPHPPAKPCPPRDPLLLCFILDGSGSIGAEAFSKNAVFIKGVLDGIHSPYRVAIIVYGTHSRVILAFTSNKTRIDIALEVILKPDSTTHTEHALLEANELIKNEPPFGTPVSVLITDGKATKHDEALAAAEVLNDRSLIAAVGIGNKINPEELKAIATDANFYFTTPDYFALVKLVNSFTQTVCKADFSKQRRRPKSPQFIKPRIGTVVVNEPKPVVDPPPPVIKPRIGTVVVNEPRPVVDPPPPAVVVNEPKPVVDPPPPVIKPRIGTVVVNEPRPVVDPPPPVIKPRIGTVVVNKPKPEISISISEEKSTDEEYSADFYVYEESQSVDVYEESQSVVEETVVVSDAKEVVSESVEETVVVSAEQSVVVNELK